MESMTVMLHRVILLLTLLFPVAANAWWHDDWSYRKELTLNTASAVTGESLKDGVVLVRLHSGNFSYFMDVSPGGEDLRFVDGDDLTPLKYHVEKFDPVNEMALIWVRIPGLDANSNTKKIWMYYGNPVATAGDDRKGVWPADYALIYHFDSEASAPRDSTAWANHSSLFTAERNISSLIGTGLRFNGAGRFEISDSPSLAMDPAKGWTLSAWIKMDRPQQSVLFSRHFVNDKWQLAIDGDKLYARLENEAGNVAETARNTTLMAGTWHHVAMVVRGNRVSLYLDGTETAYVEGMIPEMTGSIVAGSNDDGSAGFVGEMDELRIAKTALTEDSIRLAAKGEGPGSSVVVYGEDGQQEGGEGEPSYFTTTMQNVTVDGWVVIIVLMIMFAVSIAVMVSKAIVIHRIRKDNQGFLERFASLGAEDVDDLDAEDSEEEKELRDSPLLMALSGKHAHFESSNIYRIYHVGVQEMHNRMPKTVGARATELTLTPQAIDAIRATMDAALVRENQKLNSLMVLLTIAISGGPFLGLLGTVVGVMITFAAIAASGNVDVNSIAPGIAAALAATVAGLAVAIPSLFGYNYLGSRIKDISADLHVFVDEFVAKIAEQHS